MKKLLEAVHIKRWYVNSSFSTIYLFFSLILQKRKLWEQISKPCKSGWNGIYKEFFLFFFFCLSSVYRNCKRRKNLVTKLISWEEMKRIDFVTSMNLFFPYAEVEFRRHFRPSSEVFRAFVVASSKIRLVTQHHVVISRAAESSPNDVNKMAGNWLIILSLQCLA